MISRNKLGKMSSFSAAVVTAANLGAMALGYEGVDFDFTLQERWITSIYYEEWYSNDSRGNLGPTDRHRYMVKQAKEVAFGFKAGIGPDAVFVPMFTVIQPFTFHAWALDPVSYLPT